MNWSWNAEAHRQRCQRWQVFARRAVHRCTECCLRRQAPSSTGRSAPERTLHMKSSGPRAPPVIIIDRSASSASRALYDSHRKILHRKSSRLSPRAPKFTRHKIWSTKAPLMISDCGNADGLKLLGKNDTNRSSINFRFLLRNVILSRNQWNRHHKKPLFCRDRDNQKVGITTNFHGWPKMYKHKENKM